MRKTNYSYETAKFRIELSEAGYITVNFTNAAVIQQADVKLVSERIKWLANSQPYCLLIDISNSPGFSDEVQLYAASIDNHQNKLAEAIIVNSSWQARAGNLYRNYLRKQHYEQRFFIHRDKAHAWLLSRANKNSV
ncbi:MAG: hypothetical protein MUC87_08965 [Bacteroidia bacterium]|jgi:hypothetical protein|nr:hypothetical protein [Bacteroidia bacterium]